MFCHPVSPSVLRANYNQPLCFENFLSVLDDNRSDVETAVHIQYRHMILPTNNDRYFRRKMHPQYSPGRPRRPFRPVVDYRRGPDGAGLLALTFAKDLGGPEGPS